MPRTPVRRHAPTPALNIDILQVMQDFFARDYPGASWDAWRAFLTALFGLIPSRRESAVIRQATGRTRAPSSPATEAWVICGRRGGKSRIAALVAVYVACFKDYRRILARGELGTIMLLAADKKQAGVLMRYVVGLLESVPMLANLIVRKTDESVELSNHTSIEIHTSNYRAVRSYTCVAILADEVAFWDAEQSANPDTEVLNALRPTMTTVPGALLFCISSAYARRGALWEAFRNHFGKDDDPVLVWKSNTKTMNPAADDQVIAAAYAADPVAAASEYGADFRSDLEDYAAPDIVQRAVVSGRVELPPKLGASRYFAFCDPAGGSGQDSMTLAIAHSETGKVVLDLVSEARPPFSPDDVVANFCAQLAPFNLRKVTGDKYAGDWPTSRFRAHGVTYEPAEHTKSELYAAFLPTLNSGMVELLDLPRLVAQLLGLERRTAWGGRDSIDHAPNSHDDVINAAAGALVLTAARLPRPAAGVPGHITVLGEPGGAVGETIRPAAGAPNGQAGYVERGQVGGQAAMLGKFFSPYGG